MPVTETRRWGWSRARGVIDTDDTLLTAAADTMMQANVPVTAYSPDSTQNAIEVTWSMKADGEACVAYLFAARSEGDIVLVWTGTLTAGKQESTDGRFYVDTVASTTDNWITTIKEVDGGASDRMFRIVLDTVGYKKFFCQYTGLSSEDVRSYFSGF